MHRIVDGTDGIDRWICKIVGPSTFNKLRTHLVLETQVPYKYRSLSRHALKLKENIGEIE
jgi:hypothetical protein